MKKKNEKKVSVLEKNVLDPIPIPKLNLGFGSRYQNLVWVIHYSKGVGFLLAPSNF